MQEQASVIDVKLRYTDNIKEVRGNFEAAQKERIKAEKDLATMSAKRGKIREQAHANVRIAMQKEVALQQELNTLTQRQQQLASAHVAFTKQANTAQASSVKHVAGQATEYKALVGLTGRASEIEKRKLADQKHQEAVLDRYEKKYKAHTKYKDQTARAHHVAETKRQATLARIEKTGFAGFEAKVRIAQKNARITKEQAAASARVNRIEDETLKTLMKQSRARTGTTQTSTATGSGTTNGKEGFVGTMFGGAGTSFGHKVATTAQYATAGAAIYATVEAFRAAGAAALEFDAIVHKLSAVLNVTPTHAKSLADELVGLSTALGGSITEINEAALALGRAGIANKDLVAATDVTMRMALLTGDTIADATGTIVSFSTVFKDTGFSIEEFGDKLATAANVSRLSTQDIGTLANYSLTAADAIGITVDQLLGMAAAFSKAGVSASTIGTQIRKFSKAIRDDSAASVQFFDMVGTSQKQLQKDLLDPKKNEAAFKTFIDQVGNMSQEQYKAATAGMNILTVQVFDNIRKAQGDIQQFTKDLQDGTGQGLKAADEILLGYTKRWEMLGNTVLGATTKIVNNGLDVMFGETQDVEAFSNKLAVIGQRIDDVASVTPALIGALVATRVGIYAATGAVANYTAGVVGATTATRSLTAAMVLLNNNPWMKAATIALTGATAAYMYFGDTDDEITERLKSNQKEKEGVVTAEVTQLEKLAAQYNSLMIVKDALDERGIAVPTTTTDEIDRLKKELEFISGLKEADGGAAWTNVVTKAAQQSLHDYISLIKKGVGLKQDMTKGIADGFTIVEDQMSRTHSRLSTELQKQVNADGSNILETWVDIKNQIAATKVGSNERIVLEDQEAVLKTLSEIYGNKLLLQQESAKVEKRKADFLKAQAAGQLQQLVNANNLLAAGKSQVTQIKAQIMNSKMKVTSLEKELKLEKDILKQQQLRNQIAAEKSTGKGLQQDLGRAETSAGRTLEDVGSDIAFVRGNVGGSEKVAAAEAENVLAQAHLEIMRTEADLAAGRIDAAQAELAIAQQTLAIEQQKADVQNAYLQDKSVQSKVSVKGFDQETKALMSLGKNMDIIAKNDAKYQAATAENAKDGEQGKKRQILLDKKHQQDQIAGYGMIAGAMASMFEEGSKEAAAFQMIQSGLAIVSGVTAILSQGAGDPYSAFARMAAMAVSVASFLSSAGVAFSSAPSVSGDSFAMQAANEGRGSVLGDADAQSESITKSLSLLEDLAKPEFALLSQMNKSLISIDNSIGGFAANLLQQGGFAMGEGAISSSYNPWDMENNEIGGVVSAVFGNQIIDTLSGGLASSIANWAIGGIMGGLFGGSSTTSLNDSGLRFDAQLIGEAIVDAQGQAYQVMKTETDGGWFGSDSTSYSSTFQELDREMNSQFTLVIEDMYDTLLLGSEALNVSTAKIKDDVSDFYVDLGKISLKGKTGDEISEELSAVFSKTGDDMVREAYGLGADFSYDVFDSARKTWEALPTGQIWGDISEMVTHIESDAAYATRKDAYDKKRAEAYTEWLKTRKTSLDAFQQIGEGLYETMIRVGVGMEEAGYFVDRLGYAFQDTKYSSISDKQGDIGLEALRQSIERFDSAVYGANNGVLEMVDSFSGSAEELYGVYSSLEILRIQLGALGDNVSGLTSTMLRGAGGIAELTAGLDNYFEAFVGAPEQLALSTAKMAAEFARLNLEMPTSKAGFTALIDRLNLTTEIGQELYGGLMTLSEGFSELIDQTVELREAKLTYLLDTASLERQMEEERLEFLETERRAVEDALKSVANLSTALAGMGTSIQATIDKLTNKDAESSDFTQMFWDKRAEIDRLLAKGADFTKEDESTLKRMVGEINALGISLQDSTFGDDTAITASIINELDNLRDDIGFMDDALDVNIVGGLADLLGLNEDQKRALLKANADGEISRAELENISGLSEQQIIDLNDLLGLSGILSTDGTLQNLINTMDLYNNTIMNSIGAEKELSLESFVAGGDLNTVNEIKFRQSFQAESYSTFYKELDALRNNLAYLSIDTENTAAIMQELGKVDPTAYGNVVEFFQSMGAQTGGAWMTTYSDDYVDLSQFDHLYQATSALRGEMEGSTATVADWANTMAVLVDHYVDLGYGYKIWTGEFTGYLGNVSDKFTRTFDILPSYFTGMVNRELASVGVAAGFGDDVGNKAYTKYIMINGEQIALPSYDVGSPYIPHDQTANIHKGEMVIDAKTSSALRRYGIQHSSPDMSGIVNEIRGLREDSRGVSLELLKVQRKLLRLEEAREYEEV